MFTSRQKLFIVFSILVGLVAAGLLIYKLTGKSKVPAVSNLANTTSTNQNASQPSSVTPKPVIKKLTAEEQEQLYVRQLAGIFTERFATYSSQNNNQNITDVLNLATEKMGGWLKSQGSADSTVYKGVTTEVIAGQVESLVDDTAQVRVDTRRLIEDLNGQKTENKSATVKLVKSGEDWKVDGFYWE